MQVRWRGLELPARVEKDPKSATDTFGRFTAEPFVRGFGTTVGNSLAQLMEAWVRDGPGPRTIRHTALESGRGDSWKAMYIWVRTNIILARGLRRAG